MAYIIDPLSKRIILSSGTTVFSAQDMYSRWKDWLVASPSNLRFLPAFRVVGGDPIGDGIYVAQYFFLINGWRVRPYEGTHTLTVNGNLFVDGGGDPVVPTAGSYNVLVKQVVPVQAQAISPPAALTLAQIEASTIIAKEATVNKVLNATYAQM